MYYEIGRPNQSNLPLADSLDAWQRKARIIVAKQRRSSEAADSSFELGIYANNHLLIK
ncbi:MAG: hypothetical protein SOT58_10320 [Agathobacter sp.]|nr:hypothetical protein [Lachnobacterium sp.]MDY2912423.1 hypothetical protein [Agathobacter sp.]